MKNVVVVANKDLRKHGVKLVHILSKISDVKSSLYTPEQFSGNENKIAGTNYVIFLGKNSVSEPYIDLIEKKESLSKIVWGYNGTKAAIYIESSLKHEPEINPQNIKIIQDSINELLYHYKEVEVPDSGFNIDRLNPIKKYKNKKKMSVDSLYEFGINKFMNKCLTKFLK